MSSIIWFRADEKGLAFEIMYCLYFQWMLVCMFCYLFICFVFFLCLFVVLFFFLLVFIIFFPSTHPFCFIEFQTDLFLKAEVWNNFKPPPSGISQFIIIIIIICESAREQNKTKRNRNIHFRMEAAFKHNTDRNQKSIAWRIKSTSAEGPVTALNH